MIKHKEIERRVDTLEQAVNEIKEAVKTIAENSTVLARLEAHHEETRESLKRAFESIATNRKDYEVRGEKVDSRLRVVEMQMPILKLTSRWIIGVVVTVIGGVFTTAGVIAWALLPLIFKGDH